MTAIRADAGVSRSEPPLWGRDHELETIDRVVGGHTAVMRGVLIVGEPGIGKSSLWRRGVIGRRHANTPTLTTTCVSAESEMPYVALEDLLADLLDTHRSALPPPQRDALDGAFRRVAAATDPRTVAAGTLSLLRVALDTGPTVLAIDDLQWIDTESHSCLTYALRRLGRRDLTVLLAARDESPLWSSSRPPGQDTVTAAVDDTATDGLVSLRLGPLGDTAIGHLLRDQLGLTVAPEECRRLGAATGGNPFWVLQFGQHHRDDRLAEPLGPPGLEAVLAGRVGDLAPDAVAAARLVAALGRPATDTVLAALADADAPAGGHTADAEHVIDDAVEAGLVTITGGRLMPSHPLIGTALLSGLPPFRRRRLYRRAADLADSAEGRAVHLLAATATATESIDGPGVVALVAALDAACAAARRRGAARTAAYFAGRALFLLEQPSHPVDADQTVAHPAIPQRRVETAELRHRAGQVADALAMLDHVELAELDPDLLERAAPLLAEATEACRGAAAARAVTERIETMTAPAVPEALARRRALIATLRADRQCGATGDRRAAARQAVDLTGAAPVRASLRRRALGALAYALLDAGDDVEPIRQRFDALGPPDPEGASSGPDIELLHAVSRWCAVDLVEAREAFATVFHHHLEIGDSPTLGQAGAMLAVVELTVGSPESAEATLACLEDHLDHIALDQRYIVNAYGLLHLARGELDTLEQMLDRLPRDAGSARDTAFVARLRGLAAMQRGDHHLAVGHLEQFTTLAGQHQLFDRHRRLWVLADLAEALVAAEDLPRATRIAEQLASEVASTGATRSTGETITLGRQRRIAALLAEDPDRSLALAREAVTLHEHGPVPVQHGRSLVTLAEILRRRGELEAADEQRRRAHDLFARFGYRWWADHTADPVPAATDALSPSERAVADLVALGASNRDAAAELHLSVRTVENHLRSSYRKLGIRSREALRKHLAD